ncbi:MAG: homocysteine biosynthesis protein [Anaerolineae bacterium]
MSLDDRQDVENTSAARDPDAQMSRSSMGGGRLTSGLIPFMAAVSGAQAAYQIYTYWVTGMWQALVVAGAHGHVYSEGTQHAGACERTPGGVPTGGAGTLALTGDMKQMRPEFVRGVSLRGYGISTTIRQRRGIEINAGCGQLRQAAKAGIE